MHWAKKANQNKVKQGLFFVNKDDDGYDSSLYQTIWQWRDNYQGATFGQAKQNFIKQKSLVEQKLQQLQCLCELHEQVVLNNSGSKLKQQYGELGTEFEAAKQNYEQAVLQLKQTQSIEQSTINVDDDFIQAVTQAKANQQASQAAIENCQDQKTYWQHKLQALKHDKPSFFVRLFQAKQYKDYQKNLAECHVQLAQWHFDEIEAKQRLQHHLDKLQSANDDLLAEQNRIYQQELNMAQARVEQYQRQRDNYHKKISEVLEKLQELDSMAAKYGVLLNKLPNIKLPASLNELRQEDYQIAGLWHDEELNHERSCLFGLALQLHEAWLAEVSKKDCGFGGNLAKLSEFLQGNVVPTHEQALALWQSLFMVVPVVSSTFASFARQFQGLEAGSLGYLFVDEAGQAVPQAAVGAIWRAKRVMVVGDPIQIEPVFTTPPPLVRHLEAISGMPQDVVASPLVVSVQILADKYNRFGANITQNGKPSWIGSPLRVHRRCLEPMFGIANNIAYEGKMILSETSSVKQCPSKEGLYLGESGWVQIVGEAAPQQFVQAQADVVIQMLAKIVHSTGKLPDLYIITPFKKIKNELIKQIKTTDTLHSAKGLGNWCATRIGTVHTFQGKEEKMVWLVLGCDKNTSGAVQWAASKPNLLNVALTRAKRYVFIFGDKLVWANKPYFDYAIQHLPEIDSESFLSQSCELAEELDKLMPSVNTAELF
ncbi:AAA domain-containing protein [Moraxella cuniculi DSM 21768]|uniref:AAA domain-containing protein n=1 Tax=Moraxella cuniculi DSM 21768 TaxID=1122245 RepID=A0A1N7D610_9GAMM|nr:AAA domain-containing protein [Moraxella cuniculi]SIR71125.1 AAA domain-containing protein [Moraxella cuniculi DSM 21768]